MDITYWILLTLIVACAGVVRGCIGFGFSALVVASASLFMPPANIVPMIALLEIAASIQMVKTTWRFADRPVLVYLILGTLVATPLGVYALVILSADSIRLILSVVIFLMSILLISGWQYRGKKGPSALISLGLVAGVFNGAAGVGGLPVATFLTALNLSMTALRATLVMFFLLTDVVLIFSASGHGLFSQEVLVQSVAMIVPMVLGITVGSKLFAVLPEKRLRRGVIGLLMLLSLIGISRAALNLLMI